MNLSSYQAPARITLAKASLSMIIRPSAKPLVAVCVLEGLISAAIVVPVALWYPEYLLYAVGIAIILCFFMILPRLIRIKSTRIVIEDGKLCYETGLLSKSSRTMELRKVQDVRVDQTLSQRILGMGDLTVETAGESSRLTIHGIDRPRAVADRILEVARSADSKHERSHP